ncbi:hypothetical protein WS63_09275 [Burkholderia stagnalis]|uniref:hypothetical protein n=1 Tax=Burkholderia stagnalis TaxID=1503054 RepID=UPI00075C0C3A|nr:hypothetical protein [Burkholderia stagnalis]KVD92702.1 hypothetical protein WS63_09275 [Burkholderia stagnalis]KVN62431.1 hypothetical protein WT14_15075 [Burkholderia stagnalis]KVO53967.1 hypothetical protein WT18_01270 [Burkholderia stagnalis]KVP07811.1 hypothetical protein WT20_23390 [Burkholderia stagnalis]KVW89859.1 hypothetical protein WT30_28520 [Burkholderia stagnalis]
MAPAISVSPTQDELQQIKDVGISYVQAIGTQVHKLTADPEQTRDELALALNLIGQSNTLLAALQTITVDNMTAALADSGEAVDVINQCARTLADAIKTSARIATTVAAVTAFINFVASLAAGPSLSVISTGRTFLSAAKAAA